MQYQDASVTICQTNAIKLECFATVSILPIPRYQDMPLACLITLKSHSFKRKKESCPRVLCKIKSPKILFRFVFHFVFDLCLHANRSVPEGQTVNIDMIKISWCRQWICMLVLASGLQPTKSPWDTYRSKKSMYALLLLLSTAYHGDCGMHEAQCSQKLLA